LERSKGIGAASVVHLPISLAISSPADLHAPPVGVKVVLVSSAASVDELLTSFLLGVVVPAFEEARARALVRLLNVADVVVPVGGLVQRLR